MGRNPLQRPSIEQARQGVAAIRRYFNYVKKDASDTAAALEPVMRAANKQNTTGTQRKNRPVREATGASRHDWAMPGGLILLFNCHGCWVEIIEGDASSLMQEEGGTVRLVAAFNLQVVGHLRAPSSPTETFQERVVLWNEWLPWSSPDVLPEEAPTLLVEAKGSRKATLTLAVRPWLAYGCSIGARLKMHNGYCTVTAVREDDRCEVVRDVAVDGTITLIDPTPETVSRTSSPSYKPGQKLMLLHNGRLVDAVVELWLGLRRGSRHRVRLGGTSDRASRASGESFNRRKAAAPMVEVDLNESNHARLLFSTVAKYGAVRAAYLEALASKHAVVQDPTTKQSLPTIDQRIYLRTCNTADPIAVERQEVAAEGDAAAKSTIRPLSPGMGVASSRAPPVAEPLEVGAVSPIEAVTTVNALSLLEGLLAPIAEADAAAPRTPLIRTQSRAEHELLIAQSLYSLARTLGGDAAAAGSRRQVPFVLSMTRLAEMVADEAKQDKSTSPREMLISVFAAEYPNQADMLRQAIELQALVVVADVREEGDLLAFREAILEEMLAHRLLILASADVLSSTAAADLPPLFHHCCMPFGIDSLGLFMSDMNVSNAHAKDLIQEMVPDAVSTSHYNRVVALHLSRGQLGSDVIEKLSKLLGAETCALRSLDVSFNSKLDAVLLVRALEANCSLTSLDVRRVPSMCESYGALGELILQPASKSRLGFVRCDAFELLESEASLSLRERPLSLGAMKLLGGLLTKNRDLQELDLAATGIESEWVHSLVAALDKNASLTTLHLLYNSTIDEACKAALLAATAERGLNLTINF